MEYHGIIVNKSLKDESIVSSWDVIGQKEGGLILYKVSVQEENLDRFIRDFQTNINKGSWYAHFYNEDGSKLIVVFKEKLFETDNRKENWKTIVEYGKSLNVPAEQLDFVPNSFSTETY
jgi:hypothetical protein